MTPATLDSEAAFAARLKAMSFAARTSRGASPRAGAPLSAGWPLPWAQVTDEAVLKWARQLLEGDPSPFQLSCVPHLIFESHTYALADMQLRIDL